MTNDHGGTNPSSGPETNSGQQIPRTPNEKNGVAADPKGSSSGDQETAKELAGEFRTVEWIQIVINGVLAVIGIIAICIYGGQLDVMKDTLALERPWIGPTARTIVPRPEQGHIIALGWHYQNGGRAVATKIRQNLEFRIGPRPAALKSAPFSDDCQKGELAQLEQGGNIAIPGGDYIFPIDVSPEVAKSMDDVYAEKVGLYLVGCVDYSDSGRKEWYRTEVLELFLPKQTNFLVLPFGNNAR